MGDLDPVEQRLLEAVWAEPASDAPRMVYADHLLARGDELGELIALQLERARTGGVIGAREAALSASHGPRMLGPADGWVSSWQLARGFLGQFSAYSAPPSELIGHRMWATVEHAVFLGVEARVVLEALISLRTLQLWSPALDARLRAQLAAHHAGPLDQLGLELGLHDEWMLPAWEAWFATSRTARLLVRLPTLDDLTETVGADPSGYLQIEVEREGDGVFVELEDSVDPTGAFEAICALAGARRAVFVDVRRASADPRLLAALRGRFEVVETSADR